MLKYVYVLLILIILYGYTVTRYIEIAPTFPIFYPSNSDESKEVFQHMKKRTTQQIDLFYETDQSVSAAFARIIPETIDDLDNIIFNYNSIILFLKYLLNRARPAQINKNVKDKLLVSHSAATPAYPSGHSFQAFILACKMSKKYPEKKQQLYALAEDCGYARIIAGLHYPSDHRFSKALVEMFCL